MTDLYCDIIDNFWDMAFAIKVMNTFFVQQLEKDFRFFGNNLEVFTLFEKNLFPEIKIIYYDVSEIQSLIPSHKICNLFERKIDYNLLESFDFPIHLTNFSYFSLEPHVSALAPGIQSWHGKIFQHKNLTVEQYSVSLLPDTGWVFCERYYLPEIFSRDFFVKKYNLPENKKWISIFCYPETVAHLETQWFFEMSDDILFLSFGTQELPSTHTMLLPFLSMQEYYSLVQHCHANIVRGENSLISALDSSTPFFWDIYKENNMAHIGKIQDFANYLKTMWYSQDIVEAQLEGNIERNYERVKKIFQ